MNGYENTIVFNTPRLKIPTYLVWSTFKLSLANTANVCINIEQYTDSKGPKKKHVRNWKEKPVRQKSLSSGPSFDAYSTPFLLCTKMK